MTQKVDNSPYALRMYDMSGWDWQQKLLEAPILRGRAHRPTRQSGLRSLVEDSGSRPWRCLETYKDESGRRRTPLTTKLTTETNR